MKYDQISIEYRLDNMDSDSNYIDTNTLARANKLCNELKAKYGNRLVALDILCYTEEEGLERHIQII